jgi:hypothetical protein
MFAAKAGAKKVIGVRFLGSNGRRNGKADQSPPSLQIDMSNIIDQAQKIIDANGFSDSALSPSWRAFASSS